MDEAIHTCSECGKTVGLHRGLCRSCRRRALAIDRTFRGANQRMPKAPHLVPPHNQPWVSRRMG